MKYSASDEHSARDSEYVPEFHHTLECDIYFKYQTVPTIHNYLKEQPLKGFWCATHGQWTYVHPVKVTWTYPTNDKPGGATNVD